MLKQVQEAIGSAWCQWAHESVMWPVHGHYDCRTCGRSYPAFADAAGGVQDTAGPRLSTKTSGAPAWLGRA